ncbi:hypothetical protein ES288_A08G231200v1 [Gossypium darwinii]|uniref:Uncharacterized protein n=1 Tax=Gossypium darwinii TaxID=34276 RepID=A0A5D2FS67_GOSDA|nr:hypothetical protein ES288_A08G231200v1 [Gossypium darwinii]
MGLIIMCHHHITIFTIFCFTIFDGFVSNDCACLPPTCLPNLNFSNWDEP